MQNENENIDYAIDLKRLNPVVGMMFFTGVVLLCTLFMLYDILAH